MNRMRLTVRLRLALLFGSLFFVLGVVLLGLSLVLFREAMFRQPDVTARDIVRQQGGIPNRTELAALVRDIRLEERAIALRQALDQSLLAVVILALVTGVVGWLVSGIVLRPLRQVVAHVREASETSLDQPVRLVGVNDEFMELADTYNALLERLRVAFASQRRFSADVSHELRTPVSIIQAEAEMLLSAPGATPRERRAGAAILAAARRNGRLIDGLLALSRADSDLIDHAPVDVAEVAGDVVGESLPEANARGIGVRLSLGVGTVMGDRVLLGQMVANLMQNAIRHNVDGGWLAVEVGESKSGEWMDVRVSNGGSVVEGDPLNLFAPFRQGAVTTADGEGLGLAIVAAVARAHGGTVTATALADGGLIVTACLPSA